MSSKWLLWFSSKQSVIRENEKLKKQLEDINFNFEFLEKNLETYRKKSDIMDLLGDEEEFKKLVDYGSLDSILHRVSDYERLQDDYKKLENQIKKLKALNDKGD